MPVKHSPLVRTLPLLVSLLLAAGLASAKPNLGPAKAPEVIKVGITEYQNIEETYRKYEVFFAELASHAAPEEPVTFTFAIGTYGEVLDWYNNRSIDIAVLSAMPAAELLLVGERESLNQAYLGDLSVTLQKTQTQQTLIDLFGGPSEDKFIYRPGCIVLNSDTELNNFEDIKRLWDASQVKFLFVRPYSLSGYIAPLAVLQKKGIYPLSRDEGFEFTYQHKKSLERMIESLSQSSESKSKTHLVAFVLDDTRYETGKVPGDKPSDRTFRRIDLPELDTYSIPREVILANYHQEQDKLEVGDNKFKKYRELMKRLLDRWNSNRKTEVLKAHADAGKDLLVSLDWNYVDGDGWMDNYTAIQSTLKDMSLPKELLYKSDFDDLMNDLARVESPRLALVLSGGGAKCAYQAGAIIAIEQKLKNKSTELNKTLDIDLVVGTSGGAINALLVALGITKEDAAAEELAKTWSSFRQQHFLQPSWSFSLVFGICFGLLQALLIVVIVLLFDRETMNWAVTSVVLGSIAIAEVLIGSYFGIPDTYIVRLFFWQAVAVFILIALVALVDFLIHKTRILTRLQHWRQVTVVLMLIFGFVEVLIAFVAWFGTLVENISESHWVEHLWTVVTLISVWTFPYPFILGLVVVAIGSFVVPNFDWAKRREHAVLWTAIVLVILSGVLFLQLLFKETSPSESKGIEQAFLDEVPRLVKSTIDESFTFEPAAGKTKLESLSQQLLAKNLLKRDLVITTSRLPVSENQTPLPVNKLPDDLYFYHYGNKENRMPPPPDKRFVPLKYNQEKFLDVVIGSSTIYPIFAPRALSSVQLGNEAKMSSEPPIKEMRIIDGGFIHNIPIQAARRWGATHIIVIDASPAPQMRDPQHLWDNTVMAFGYLFKQAQAGDALERVGTFELRPSSRCEKLNVKAVCTDSDPPEPNMDLFDFSDRAARKAFDKGWADVNHGGPLFVRVPGAPVFRTVSAQKPQKP